VALRPPHAGLIRASKAGVDATLRF